MAILRYDDSSNLITPLSTQLNSLANASLVVSDPIDNTQDLDIYADIELVVKYSSTVPASGNKVAEIYFLYSVDNDFYAEGSSSITPARSSLVASLESVNPSISTFERLIVSGITLPARFFKIVVKNTSGRSWTSSGNLLRVKKYKLESV